MMLKTIFECSKGGADKNIIIIPVGYYSVWKEVPVDFIADLALHYNFKRVLLVLRSVARVNKSDRVGIGPCTNFQAQIESQELSPNGK